MNFDRNGPYHLSLLKFYKHLLKPQMIEGKMLILPRQGRMKVIKGPQLIFLFERKTLIKFHYPSKPPQSKSLLQEEETDTQPLFSLPHNDNVF